MARKSKPWRVILRTALGSGAPTDHASQVKAYQQVTDELRRIKAGESTATQVCVFSWVELLDKWMPYEFLNPEEQ